MSHIVAKVLVVFLALSVAQPAFAQFNHFATFEIPGSTYTCAMSINAKGTTVGVYFDANGVAHGFLRLHNGKFANLDPFGYAGWPASINDNGDVVGYYYDGTTSHGFIYKDGTFASYDRPGGRTDLWAINNLGHFVGSVVYPVDITRDESFLVTPESVIQIKTAYPETHAWGINDFDVVVGDETETTGVFSAGFVRFPDGTYVDMVYPGAARTHLLDINNLGQILGNAEFNWGLPIPFIYDNGQFTPLKVSLPNAFVTGLSNKSDICGCYRQNDDSPQRAFIGRIGKK